MKARMKPEGKTEKILLVTGASSETGCALIRKCAGMYSRIWAHYGCSIEELNALQREWGDRIIPIQADFSREGSVEEMLAQIGDADAYPDHVVHLAAPKTCNKQFHKCHWEDYQKGVDISLRSAVLLLERLIPRMQKKRYGKIVFMLTSYVLGGVPPKYQSPYITVKYALYGLMRNLAAEYAAKGITVNAVSPDMMETKFLSEIPDLVIRQNAERNPLGRNIAVEDVIPAILYLLSDSAEAVTGQNIGVTGGVR